MIKVNKRIVIGIVTVLLMSGSMSACTYTENTLSNAGTMEDNHRSGDKSKRTEIVTRDPDAPAEPVTQDVSSGHMVKMGEEVSEISVQNGALIPDAFLYTIHKAEQFTDYAQAGISKDEMNPFVETFLLDEQGNLKSSVKFIVVEMTVENSRAELDQNITSFSLLCADSAEGISNETTKINFFELPIPTYFSNPSGTKVGEDWKGYYAYRLPVGQRKTMKVGWYVDLDQYDLSRLYLVFNRNHDQYEKLVKVEFIDD